MVLWNTRCLDAAVARLRAEGHDTKDEDVARLSPLKDRHINFLGRYLFNIKASGPGQGLRPLRDPDAPELDEDDEGEECRDTPVGTGPPRSRPDAMPVARATPGSSPMKQGGRWRSGPCTPSGGPFSQSL